MTRSSFRIKLARLSTASTGATSRPVEPHPAAAAAAAKTADARPAGRANRLPAPARRRLRQVGHGAEPPRGGAQPRSRLHRLATAARREPHVQQRNWTTVRRPPPDAAALCHAVDARPGHHRRRRPAVLPRTRDARPHDGAIAVGGALPAQAAPPAAPPPADDSAAAADGARADALPPVEPGRG